MEEQTPLLNVRRFIAVNPPVSTEYALHRIDELVNISANWNKSDMLARLTDNAGRVFMKMNRRYRHFDPADKDIDPWTYQIPLDKDVAGYVVGLSLKLSMRELLLAQHMEQPLAEFPEYQWNKRNDLYMAIDRITFADYAEKFLKPCYSNRTLPELLARSHLRSLENTLRNSPKIRVFHTLDDFLVSENDRKYLDSVLRDRIVWFSNGGHLGSLYYLRAAESVINAAVH
jgi:hypothetical protein